MKKTPARGARREKKAADPASLVKSIGRLNLTKQLAFVRKLQREVIQYVAKLPTGSWENFRNELEFE